MKTIEVMLRMLLTYYVVKSNPSKLLLNCVLCINLGIKYEAEKDLKIRFSGSAYHAMCMIQREDKNIRNAKE